MMRGPRRSHANPLAQQHIGGVPMVTELLESTGASRVRPLAASTDAPQQLDILIDSLLAPWSKRTKRELQRAVHRQLVARQRAELRALLAIIVARVEKLFRLPLGALSSERRTSRIAMARHIAYYLCHVAGGSFPVIGQRLGRDHSSVHHGFWLI